MTARTHHAVCVVLCLLGLAAMTQAYPTTFTPVSRPTYIDIFWTMSDGDAGLMYNASIAIFTPPSDPFFTAAVPAVNNSTRFTGLAPSTVYKVTLNTLTKLASTTAATKPDSVELSVVFVNRTAIEVSWPMPYDEGSTITSYQVFWCSQDNCALAFQVDSTVLPSTQLRAINRTPLTQNTIYWVGAIASAVNNKTSSLAVLQVSTLPGVPDSPIPSIFAISQRFVTLQWAPPNTYGTPVTSYNVTVTGAARVDAVIAATATSASIFGLSANRSYNITMAANSLSGLSPFSLPIAFTTPPAAQPDTLNATAYTVRNFNYSAVNISWVPPYDFGDALTNYTVELRRVDGITNTTTVVVRVAYALFTGLQSNTNYWVNVTASNRLGKGPIGELKPFTTLPGPPDPVPCPVLGSTTSTTLDVTWTMPASNGADIVFYNVTAAENSSMTLRPHFAVVAAPATMTTLTSMAMFTRYFVRVVAINSVGGSLSSCLANFTTKDGVPNQVTGVTASVAGEVRWVAPRDNGKPILAYNISLTDGYTTEYFTAGLLIFSLGDATTLNINTVYNVTVVAINGNGRSVPSVPVSFLTDPGAPSIVDVNSVVFTPQQTYMDISWTPPNDNGSPITLYYVSFKDFVQTNASSLHVGSLSPSTSYSFEVLAQNGFGFGPPLDISDVRTLDPTIPDTPSGVTAVNTTQSSFIVQWVAPYNRGSPLVNYTIGATAVGTGITTLFYATPPATMVMTHDLVFNTNYVITVVATNALGDSAASDPAAILTAPGVPSAVIPNVSVRTQTEVELTWPAPASNGADIVYYIADGALDSSFSVIVSTQNCTMPPCRLTGLILNTNYSIRVRAFNSVGASAAMSPLRVLTLPGVPNMVALTLAAFNQTSATVTWSAPFDNGAAVTGYAVRVTGGAVNVTMTVTMTSFSISSLMLNTLYTVTVASLNSVGAALVATQVVLTSPGIPDAVNFTLTPLQTDIIVMWPAPRDNGAPIVNYTVYADTSAGAVNAGTPMWLFSLAPSNTSFMLSNLNISVDYYFAVVATNMVGMSPRAGAIKVRTLPGVPSKMAAPVIDSITQTSIHATWLPPTSDFGSTVVNYTLVAVPVKAGGPRMSYPMGLVLNGTATGLTANTNYSLFVVAVNSVGNSPDGAVAVVLTMPGAPLPGVVALVDRQQTSLTINWTSFDDNGMSITAYTVTVSGMAPIVGAVSPLVISPLTFNTAYNISVTAANGLGSSSAATLATMTLPGPPNAVTSFAAATIGYYSACFNVAPPTLNGAPVTSYILSVGSHMSVHSPNATTICGLQLTPATLYTATVSTNSTAGVSPVSATVSVTTRNPDVPSPVGCPILVALNYSAFSASWSAPFNNGSAITAYQLTAVDMAGRELTLSATVSGTTFTFSTAVAAFTNYSVSVVAVNAVGAGASACAAQVTTPAGPPAMLVVSVLPFNSTAVNVTWAVPYAYGSPITGYSAQLSEFADFHVVLNTRNTTMRVWTVFNGLNVHGDYYARVVAFNAIGASPMSVVAHGLSGVGAPLDMDCPLGIPRNTTAMRVLWVAATERGSPVTMYRVLVSNSSQGAPYATVNVLAPSLTVDVPGRPGISYYFRVVAISAAGTSGSSCSDPTAALTAAAVPDQVALPLLIGGRRSLTVMWTAPCANNDPIIRYDVTLNTPGGINASVSVTSGLNVTVYNLTGAATYRVRVSAVNSFGSGAPSPAATLSTNGDVPNAIPCDSITVSDTSATTLDVEWTAPDSNGVTITGYHIYVTSNEGFAFDDILGAGLAATITGLNVTTTYTIRVFAVNAIGMATGACAVMGTTTAAVPMAVTPMVTLVTAHSLNFTWAPAVSQGAPIIGYVATLTGPAGATMMSTTLPGVVFTGLSPMTSYTLRVTVNSTVGLSAASLPVSTSTLSDAPAAVCSVVVGTVTATSVVLTWSAPNNNGAAIIGYMISYTANGRTNSTTVTILGSTVTGLQPSTSYSLTVTAGNINGYLYTGCPVSFTTAPLPRTPAPTDMVVDTTGDAIVWFAQVGDEAVTYVVLEVSTSASFASFQPITANVVRGPARLLLQNLGSATISLANLAPGNYFIRLRLGTAAGLGAPSQPRSLALDGSQSTTGATTGSAQIPNSPPPPPKNDLTFGLFDYDIIIIPVVAFLLIVLICVLCIKSRKPAEPNSNRSRGGQRGGPRGGGQLEDGGDDDIPDWVREDTAVGVEQTPHGLRGSGSGSDADSPHAKKKPAAAAGPDKTQPGQKKPAAGAAPAAAATAETAATAKGAPAAKPAAATAKPAPAATATTGGATAPAARSGVVERGRGAADSPATKAPTEPRDLASIDIELPEVEDGARRGRAETRLNTEVSSDEDRYGNKPPKKPAATAPTAGTGRAAPAAPGAPVVNAVFAPPAFTPGEDPFAPKAGVAQTNPFGGDPFAAPAGATGWGAGSSFDWPPTTGNDAWGGKDTSFVEPQHNTTNRTFVADGNQSIDVSNVWGEQPSFGAPFPAPASLSPSSVTGPPPRAASIAPSSRPMSIVRDVNDDSNDGLEGVSERGSIIFQAFTGTATNNPSEFNPFGGSFGGVTHTDAHDDNFDPFADTSHHLAAPVAVPVFDDGHHESPRGLTTPRGHSGTSTPRSLVTSTPAAVETIAPLATRPLEILRPRTPSPIRPPMAEKKSAAFNLEVNLRERVHALYVGPTLKECAIMGEVAFTFTPVGKGETPTPFVFELKNMEHVTEVVPNGNYCRALPGHPERFTCTPPESLDAPARVVVIKYKLPEDYQPVPVRLLLRRQTEGDQVNLVVHYVANPTLTGHLVDANISVAPLGTGVAAMQLKPAGQWDDVGQRVVWKLPKLEGEGRLAARYRCEKAPGEEEGTIETSFKCHDASLSTLDVVVAPSPGVVWVGTVGRQFLSGDYKVSLA